MGLSCMGLKAGFGGILGGAPTLEPLKSAGLGLDEFAGSKQASY